MKHVFSHISKKDVIFIILVVAIFMGSFYIRWHNMSTTPYGIEEDEYAWVASAQFHSKGIDAGTKGIWSIHIGNEKNYPLSVWINELAFHIFGTDILSARKMLAIVSVLSLIALFSVLTFFFNKYIAILLVAAYSFSTYKLISSKIALPSVYQELPMLCAFVFALLVQKYSGWKQYLFAFGSGVCVVLSLLSYNITYMVPIITGGFLLFGLLKQPFRWKRAIFCVFSYLLPILFCLPFFLSVIQREFESKQYIFNQSNTQTTTAHAFITPQSLAIHIQAAWNILWNPLTASNSDMLLSYPYPMIPRMITIGAIIGLALACFYWRKYWPFILWAVLQSMIYHIIFGFNLPRTWILTVGALYVLTGVTIQTVVHTFHRVKRKKIIIITLLGCLLYLIISGVIIYFASATQYVAYKTHIRQIFDLSKKYQIQPLGNIIVIKGENDSGLDTWHTAVTFNYSDLFPQNISMIHTYSQQDFGILTFNEFYNRFYSYRIPTCATVISEPFRIQIIGNILQSQCPLQYKIEKYTIYWVATPT